MLSVAIPIVIDVLIVALVLRLLPRRIFRVLHLNHLPGAVGSAAVLSAALYLVGGQFFAYRIAEASTTYAHDVIWPDDVAACAADLRAKYAMRSQDFLERAVGANPDRLPSPSEIEQVEIIGFQAIRDAAVRNGAGDERRLMGYALRSYCTEAQTGVTTAQAH